MAQFIPGENSDMVQDTSGESSESCPGCGQPYRHQPNPIKSDGDLRNVPEPGALQEDSGGNPLQEGVYADTDDGWRNRMKRDESFASVRSNWDELQRSEGQYGQPGPMHFPEAEVCPVCGQSIRGEDPSHLVGIGREGDPVRDDRDIPHGSIPANDHLSSWFEDRTKIYAPWNYAGEHLANDLQVEQTQVIKPGPHTVEIDTTEDNPLILQHDNPELLDDAKTKLEAKTAAPALALIPEGLAALFSGGAAAAGEAGATGAAVGAGEAGAAGAGAASGAAAGEAGAAGAATAGEGAATGAEGAAAGAGTGASAGEQAAADTAGVAGQAEQDSQGVVQKALKSKQWGALKKLYNGMQQTQGNPLQQQQPQAMETPEPLLSSLHNQLVSAQDEDYDRPGSDDKYEERNGDEPHDVDPHEFEDGEDKGLYDRDDNEVGGSQNPHHERDQDNHPENEHGDGEPPELSGGLLSQIQSLLPLLLHHSQQGTGQDDPMIQDLFNNLNAVNPGFADNPHVEMMVIGPHGQDQGMEKESEPPEHPKKATVTPSELAGPSLTPSPPTSQPTTPAAPGAGNSCPYCGTPTTPGQKCPTCSAAVAGGKIAGPMPPAGPPMGGPAGPPGGMPMMPPPPPPPGSSGSQGPHTREQLAGVAALLEAEGRKDEILNMLENPQNYGDELAKVQKRDAPPELGDADQNPTPAQEEAPPGDTMPMPNPADQDQSQMLSRFKVAVDNIAKPCPECGSHSTGLINDEGKAACRTCGHTFGDDINMIESKTADQHFPNAEGVPAAEQEQQPDPLAAQDPSHTWVDQHGDPLQVGRQYQMFSAQYDIPDIITITSVKPNGVKYEISGEYGLAHETEVTKEEADLDGLSFTPMDHADSMGEDFSPETNDDDTGVREVNESDISTPHQQMYSRTSNLALYEQLADMRQGCPAHIEAQIDNKVRHEGPLAAIQYLQDQGVTAPQPSNADGVGHENLSDPWTERLAAGALDQIGQQAGQAAQQAAGQAAQQGLNGAGHGWQPGMAHDLLSQRAEQMQGTQADQGQKIQQGQYNPNAHTQENYNWVAQQMGVHPNQVQGYLQQFYQSQQKPGQQPTGPNALQKSEIATSEEGYDPQGGSQFHYSPNAVQGQGTQQHYAPVGESQGWNTGVNQLANPQTPSDIAPAPGPQGQMVQREIGLQNQQNQNAQQLQNLQQAQQGAGGQLNPNYQQTINQQGQQIQQAQQNLNTGSVHGLLAKEAGGHYTPMEQRELIEESGVARNSDKLDLSNTHYLDEDLDFATFW